MSPLILVVEDDPANALLTMAILRSQRDFDIVLARSTEDVFAHVASGSDLVLMDVSLKGYRLEDTEVDGLELTRRLRELDASLPIILLTAHAMAGDRERLLFACGANDYLAKPIEDPGMLIDLVRRHLEEKSKRLKESRPGS